MYKKVSTDLNFVDREKATEKFWAENDIFEKSMKQREGNEMYICLLYTSVMINVRLFKIFSHCIMMMHAVPSADSLSLIHI